MNYSLNAAKTRHRRLKVKKIYLAKKGDSVVHHADLDALKSIDGIETPDMEITEVEYEAAGGLVRLIDGEIILGKTEAETTAELNAARKAEIEAALAAIDAKSGRAARAVAIAVASGKTPVKADVDKLTALEAEVKSLRTELVAL
jgi:hypothetical protein